MAGTTNFLVWNPNQINQETDAQYSADSQRTGGATDLSPFPSLTANKAFYQWSTAIAALMQMMANKGFSVSDTNFGTLTSVLAALLTTADMRKPLQLVSYSASVSVDASQYAAFQISVNGPVSITVSNISAGNKITFILFQDSVGHEVTLTNQNHGFFYDQTPNSISVVELIPHYDTVLSLVDPGISNTGINATPIGQGTGSGSQQPGSFTTLSSSALATLASALITTLTATSASFTTGTITTPASTDNSNEIINSAWAKLGLATSFGTNGYIKFPTWLGGLIIQWGYISGIAGGSGTPVTFPISFSTAVYCLMVNPTGTNSSNYAWSNNVSTTGFNAIDNGTVPAGYWFAIGK